MNAIAICATSTLTFLLQIDFAVRILQAVNWNESAKNFIEESSIATVAKHLLHRFCMRKRSGFLCDVKANFQYKSASFSAGKLDLSEKSSIVLHQSILRIIGFLRLHKRILNFHFISLQSLLRARFFSQRKEGSILVMAINLLGRGAMLVTTTKDLLSSWRLIFLPPLKVSRLYQVCLWCVRSGNIMNVLAWIYKLAQINFAGNEKW